MALEAPLSCPANILPYSENPICLTLTASDPRCGQCLFHPSQFLAVIRFPETPLAHRASASAMSLLSPSDIVGPSPVTSNGTETTEIEDDVAEDVQHAHMTDVAALRGSGLPVLATNLPDAVRQPSSEDAVSVIHAPESLSSWSPPSLSRPPISTDVKPVRYSIDSATPRAQDLQDMLNDSARLRSSSSSSLEKIDEQAEAEVDDEDDMDDDAYRQRPLTSSETDGIASLRAALHECWTLTNTLANLSSKHRNQVFNNSETPDAHEKAWKTCWKLCKHLYHDQGGDNESQNVTTNLHLCRDFCQALFDVRQRRDETADSVLRVSFELNNHVQNSMKLPEAFRARTLDFYITLCHRLMKQRSELAKETNELLRACWGLAEMLFSMRQRRRDGRSADEGLLGSAVLACWELCDIFRDGWTQIRPDRDTPRPSQTAFFMDQAGVESRRSSRSSVYSKRDSVKSLQEERPRKPPPVPETPITEFEDTPVSPESRSPQLPNIMVLGTTTSEGGRGGRWSSNASNMSSYSRSSNRTSSTAKTTAVGDFNMARAKILVVRAAMDLGFDRDSRGADGKEANGASLQNFVQGLRAATLGSSAAAAVTSTSSSSSSSPSMPSQATLLQQYQKSIVVDALIPRGQALPSRGERVSAQDMAKSVQALGSSSPRLAYLRDLFLLVFQFPIEEAESRRNVLITLPFLVLTLNQQKKMIKTQSVYDYDKKKPPNTRNPYSPTPTT
ncbi:hypothetical protein L249_0342 [Ophiocordyceps polyrhachis-furcata BCC 54312]|uniref:DUF7624 domain-containing protein n=1 Tax=Ophiocordyceps polyrhachis-furcata BCC 54312 TaxID=1330021 RepID=A0A367LFQ5_9HYPO|nr:hypothetical protein L249_0342 [Ophiocordyceps polyrhachis-furcata BCC 54312]